MRHLAFVLVPLALIGLTGCEDAQREYQNELSLYAICRAAITFQPQCPSKATAGGGGMN
jgi:hypothetical protein